MGAMERRGRYRGCLLGLAVGDAIGTTVEFQPRGTFAPLTDLVGGGPFGLSAGQWTDDTSMALCLATSLVECRGFDAADQMRRYQRWYRDGYLSSTGRCFDIGTTVRAALERFAHTGDPDSGSSEPHTAGNGALMRLAPVPMFFARDLRAAERFAELSTRTTHAAEECLQASRLFARILVRALAGVGRDDLQTAADAVDFSSPKIAALARGGLGRKTPAEITGNGYVVNSLEAALWAFESTRSFGDAVLAAANLGDDADTTAAICGQIAGAHYGVTGIPDAWLSALTLRAEIEALADALLALSDAAIAAAPQ